MEKTIHVLVLLYDCLKICVKMSLIICLVVYKQTKAQRGGSVDCNVVVQDPQAFVSIKGKIDYIIPSH